LIELVLDIDQINFWH